MSLCFHKVLMRVRCPKCEAGGNGRYGVHEEARSMTRPEYDRLRMAFFRWANAEGLSVGNDESGYNDDEPIAAAIWKAWLAAVNAALHTPPEGQPMLDGRDTDRQDQPEELGRNES